MKLVKIFSVLSLMVIAAACGSSQPVTSAGYNTNGVYPSYSGGVPGSTNIFQPQIAVNGSFLQASGYVNAGERITLNLAAASYGVYDALCGHSWYNQLHKYNHPAGAARQLTGASVTFNGQAMSGTFVAPTAGTVMITANLDPSPFSIPCGVLYDNQVAVPQIYFVNLAGVVSK